MRNLASIVANYDSASTGFSDGETVRDRPPIIETTEG